MGSHSETLFNCAKVYRCLDNTERASNRTSTSFERHDEGYFLILLSFIPSCLGI